MQRPRGRSAPPRPRQWHRNRPPHRGVPRRRSPGRRPDLLRENAGDPTTAVFVRQPFATVGSRRPSTLKELLISTTSAQPFRELSSRFADLRDQTAGLDQAPGPGFLAASTPLLLASQQATADLVAALTTLSSSPYTTVPGSQAALDTLTAAVATASLASLDLSQAIAANPLGGLGFPGPPVDEDAVRQLLHADARPEIRKYLAEAVESFELVSPCCGYAAGGITRDLQQAARDEKLPNLTAGQLVTLAALARGEGRRYESDRRGTIKIQAADGTSVNTATFKVFEKHRLVHVSTSAPLILGQAVSVTDRGHRLLAQPRLAAPAVSRPVAARPAATATAGRGR
ncbi:hypothetical protein ACFVP0_10095 [Streptomyces cinereoruber]|uniref:hypothetical protein n=1 Tax=Streptomyces cinereoruber TaxID=67260 RepID=UPI00369D6B45